eukprot:gnl/TRDRNA2_/TRDRNA2_167338_c0_seq1.p1 gnl/TRDRNA2_/TRDRNA2_167338_c0~~gnl/TRDRNA2_/TRDRNA2_167338_c0_seq1.p1  ORF type:complete len:402 (-),score=60.13 gnl/TRDRNA2_/TRDRNA2_167338_c0_seq1:45-1250(-)
MSAAATKRRYMSRVAAGHAARGGSPLLLDLDGNGDPVAILKPLDEAEGSTYDRLWNSSESDPIHSFVAKFEGVVNDVDENGLPCKYCRMSNLLHRFRQPKVMDVKLGVRTFLEAECDNKKFRNDLFVRMLQLYPDEVTEEDRSRAGVTKLRWMSLRDTSSTIRQLGFRIDGIAGSDRWNKGDLDDELTKIMSRNEARSAFTCFVEVAATDCGQEPNGASPVHIAECMLQRLRAIREAFQASNFVRQHECIGTSILLVADAHGNTGCFWIDFGKTRLVPNGGELSHRAAWAPGMDNHEDGILTGLDSMVEVWTEVHELLRRNSQRSAHGYLFSVMRCARSVTTWSESTARDDEDMPHLERSWSTCVHWGPEGELRRLPSITCDPPPPPCSSWWRRIGSCCSP